MTGEIPDPNGESGTESGPAGTWALTVDEAWNLLMNAVNQRTLDRTAEIGRAERKTVPAGPAEDLPRLRTQYGTLEDLEQAAIRERDQREAGETP